MGHKWSRKGVRVPYRVNKVDTILVIRVVKHSAPNANIQAQIVKLMYEIF